MEPIDTGRIYNEHCQSTLERMPDDFLDMTLTSPPYDDLRKYNGYHVPYRAIASLLYKKTKLGGVVIWVVGDRTLNGSETLTSFGHAFAFRDNGFRVHDTMIFAKNNPIPSDCGLRYRQSFDYIFCFSKGTPKTFNPITQPVKQQKKFKSFRITKTGRNDLAHDHAAPQHRKANNIFYYNVGSASSTDKIAFQHPAIFPEALASDQISTWSNPGDIVYDPFLGSGTTAVVAERLNRNWIGSELSPEYYGLAMERLGATD
jgi:DNA modification methylase